MEISLSERPSKLVPVTRVSSALEQSKYDFGCHYKLYPKDGHLGIKMVILGLKMAKNLLENIFI